MAAVLAERTGSPHPTQPRRSRRRLEVLVVAAIALVAGYVWMSMSPSVIDGDEPHYVVVADSLVHHHTLDLRASYADPNGVRKFVPGIRPHVVTRDDGRMEPWPQGIGLPILITPAWWLRHSFRAVRLELLLIGVLLCVQLWSLITDLRPRWREGAAIWFVVIASLPIVASMTQIYPDLPAALLIATALRAVVHLRRGREHPMRALVLLSICCGLLPWFHVRYLVVAAGLALAGVIVAVQTGRVALRALLVAALPAVGILALLGGLDLWMYDTIRPSTLNNFITHGRAHWSLSGMYRYGLGEFIGASRGLLVFAPVYIVLTAAALAALWLRRRDAATLVIAGAVAVYLFGVLPYATFGTDLPARYTVALIPLIVAGAAGVLPGRPVLFLGALGLGVVSVALAFFAAPHMERILIRPAAAPAVHYYDGAFPRVELLTGLDRAAHAPTPVAHAPIGSEGPRVEAPWPTDPLRRAPHVARVGVAVAGDRPQTVGVEALDDRGVFARTTATVGRSTANVVLPFTTRADDSIVRIVLVAPSPRTSLVPGRLHIERVGPAQDRSQPTRHDVPKGVLWCIVLVLMAAAIVAARPRTSSA